MKDRKITHEVKLQKSVIIILAVLAIGVMANAFAPALNVKSALARTYSAIEKLHITNEPSYDSTPEAFRIDVRCTGCN